MRQIIYRKIFIILIFSLFFVHTYAAEKQPVWLNNLEKQYPSDEFLAVLGQGLSENDAKNDAAAQISMYFETRIQTQTKTYVAATKSNSSVTSDSSLNIETNISSDISLVQLQYSEVYHNKKDKRWYVAAYINRNQAFLSLKSKIDIPAQKIEDFLVLSENEENELKSALFLQNAYNFSQNFIENYEFFSILCPNSIILYKNTYEKVLSIPALLKTKFSNISFKIFVENDENNAIFNKINEILNQSGFIFNQNEGKYSIFVKIQMDEKALETGYVFYPGFEAVVKNDNQIITTFSQKGNKCMAKNLDTAKKRAYKEIEKTFEEAYNIQFMNINL